MGLAHALVRQEKLGDAAPHFRQAAQIDPSYRDGLLELAGLYEKNNQVPEALAILREFPDNAAAQEHLGELMLRNKQYADAIPSLEKAYSADPTPANRAALALVYQANGDTAKALPLLEKAAEADSASFDLHFTYGQALLETKQYPAAAAQFNQAAKIKPADMRAWSNFGAALYLAGRPGAISRRYRPRPRIGRKHRRKLVPARHHFGQAQAVEARARGVPAVPLDEPRGT